MRNGLILSFIVHVVVVVLAVFGLPFLKAEPPQMADRPIVIDLVQVGERTAAPPPAPKKKEAPKPEPVKKEEPEPQPEPVPPTPPEPPPAPEPEPEPEPVPAPPPPPEPEPEPEPEPKAAPEPEPKKEKEVAKAPPPPKKPAPPRKPEPPKEVAQKEEPKKPEPKKKKKEEPDPFKSLLKNVEAFRKENETAPKKQPKPTQTAAASNTDTPRVRNAPIASQATMSELDAIRRQIEERWIVDPGALGVKDMVVRLRVFMNPDGQVADVKVLDTARYYAEPAFRAVAESAVRAVYKASPLEYPVKKYDEFKVMELNFRPQERI